MPVPSAKPETRTHQVEKIPVAEEIKQRLPFQPGRPNNVPHPAPRAEVSRAAAPFDIDRTLIEIDQIPLDNARPARDEAKSAEAAFPGIKKRAMFEEFEEPARRKPKAAVVAVAAGVVLLVASAGFLVLKPKKNGALSSANAAGVEESQAAGAVSRPSDIKPYPDTAGAELVEPKRS